MTRSTITTNEDLPLRVGEFETLAEGLDYAARGQTGCNFFSERGVLNRAMTYREIREEALDLAPRLVASGLERGSRVALIAETRPEFFVFFFACQYAGIVPVPLPLSVNLGGRDAYVARLAAMMKRAAVSAAVASDDLIDMLRSAGQEAGIKRVGTHEEFRAMSAKNGFLRPLERQDPCYIQFSSGSTSLPRGVLVTQKAITSNARGIGQHGLALQPGDRATSWLPLYHDMGLVGFFLTPALAQVSIDYLSTTTFARRPMLWLKILSEYGGTISFSPTFGYDLCLRRSTNVDPAQFELSQWRVAGIGGEMVRASVLQGFAERFAESGFKPKAFLPCYGLAESTLAVSFTHLDTGLQLDHVDRESAALKGVAVPVSPNQDGAAASVRTFVKCGRVLPGHAVEIRGDEDRKLPERAIGRVCVQGPSLMQGYYRDLEATRSVITPDGWLDTGDLGYLVDGELVITGRSKDLIICNGRNIWPQDLEWAVEKLDGVRAGDVAAFAHGDDEDNERVILVVECRTPDPEAREALRRNVAAVVQKTAGVSCEVVLAPPRSLTFTSSGKLSRAAAKADYVAGRIRDVNEDLQSSHQDSPVLAMAVGSD